MKNKRRNLGLVLFVVITLFTCLLQTEALAVAGESEPVASGTCGAEGSNLTWTLTSDGVLTIRGKGAMEDYGLYDYSRPWADYKNRDKITSVVIESGVTSVGNCQFRDYSSLISISFPKSVESIGERAFSGCTSLKSAYLPEGVKNIGEEAFNWCSSLTSVTIPSSVTTIGDSVFCCCSSLTNVTIPEGVTSIGECAFFSCTSLESIDLPESVKNIGISAFRDCDKLTRINIPNNVTSICDCTFGNSRSLTSISLPSSITSIGNDVFYNSGLTDVYYGGSEEQWASIAVGDRNDDLAAANIHYNIYYTTIIESGNCGDNLTWMLDKNGIFCIMGTGEMKTNYLSPSPWSQHSNDIISVYIDDGITTIGGDAFYSNYNLESVFIPNGVLSIGRSSFSWCTKLKSVAIPDTVTTIYSSAFNHCESLQSVVLPEKLTSISDELFCSCTALTTVTIPEGVSTIGNDAFWGCAKLTDIYYGGTEAQWTALAANASVPAGATVHYAGIASGNCGDPSNPGGADSVKWMLDSEGTLTISGTGAMNDYSFGDDRWDNHTSDIKTVIINDGVTSIGDYAFFNCTELAEVTIPSSVESIGNHAFYYCFGLKKVVLPDRLSSIGCESFCFSGITSVALPESLISIDDRAFAECNGLTNVTIPQNVTHLGVGIFSACRFLQSIDVSENNSSYSSIDGVLFNESKTELMAYPCNRVDSSYAIHDTVTDISDYAFYYCNGVATVTIPDSVNNIGDKNFVSCGISSISVAENNNSYSSTDGVLFNKNGTELIVYPSRKEASSYRIPDEVTCIGWMAFAGCSNLTNVFIPNGVTTIPDYTFYCCQGLTDIVLPDSVTVIGGYAFESCSELRSVAFSGNMEKIGFDAFGYCTALSDVYFSGTEEQWNVLKVSIGSGNDPLLDATVHFAAMPEVIEEFSVASPANVNITAPSDGWVIGENTFSVTAERPCVLAVSYDGGQTYTRLKASANSDGSYSFDVNITDESTVVACSIFGDSNGDGDLSSGDVSRLNAGILHKVDMSPLSALACDVNGDGDLSSGDISRLNAAILNKVKLSW